MFTFTPLLGAQSPSSASQSVLEFDRGVKILIDVGWDEAFDAENLKDLERALAAQSSLLYKSSAVPQDQPTTNHISNREVPTISAILLTHATLSHIGAFAHCCKHFPLFARIPVYATLPVITLGRTLLQDVYASTPLASSTLPTSAISDSTYPSATTGSSEKSSILLQPPTHDEIAQYFREIIPLKFSQTHQPVASPLAPPLEGLTITAFGAGHTLGGTIWHVQHGSESVVYAVDWNQARENILSGAAWLGGEGSAGAEVIEQLRRPTALVCSSRGVERATLSGGWKKRDEILLQSIRPTIEDGGTVLIPCDSSARVLELAYVLEHAWRNESSDASAGSLNRAKLYLAGRTYGATIHNTKRMLEWMNEGVVREFEAATNATQQTTGSQRQNPDQADRSQAHPFEFKFLKVLERETQLDRVLAHGGPKVFLASDASLEWGFAKDLLQRVGQNDKNLIVLTEQSNRRIASANRSNLGLNETLYKIWDTHTKNSTVSAGAAAENPLVVQCDNERAQVSQVEVSALAGKDLALYQHYLAEQRQRLNTANIDKTSKLESSADVVDEGSSSSSSSSADSETELQGRALNLSATMNYSRHKLGLTDDELGINILLRRKGIHDYDIRAKKGRERMFPYVAKRRRGDDFGELIRPEEYLREEEREDNLLDDKRGQEAHKDSSMGQKRKWGNKSADKSDPRKRTSSATKKQRQVQDANQANSKAGVEGRLGDDGSADETDESDYEPAEPTIQGPTKVTVTPLDITLNTKLVLVDYSGLHDKRSLQMLLPLIKPRKIILTCGDAEETASLAEDCRKLIQSSSDRVSESSDADVFTPSMGSVVDASVDTNAWTIKLSQSLVGRLHWQTVRGLSVVTVTGRMMPPDNATDEHDKTNKKQKLESATDKDAANDQTDAGNSLAPILDVVPPNLAAATRSVTQPLHVGDLRLADLRKLMQAAGHSAEFKGEGTLLIDGIIAVRKSGVGKIEVESGTSFGAMQSPSWHSGSFYNVKKRIYESLAVVTAG